MHGCLHICAFICMSVCMCVWKMDAMRDADVEMYVDYPAVFE